MSRLLNPQARLRARTWMGLTSAVLLSATAFAQTQPDAGALQQQMERERVQQLPRAAGIDRPATPATSQPAQGPLVSVREFRWQGNTRLSAIELQAVVAAYLHRPLDFAQLQGAAAAVAAAYRTAGWVADAYLPPQDIREGVVTIQVVEAVFGKVILDGKQARRVAADRMMSLFAAQQASGAPLNADSLDRALLLADDLPGVAVTGSLVAGAGRSETDVLLKTADEPLVAGEAAVDNTGSRSTGAERLSANVNLASPWGNGDLLAANAIHTQGSDYLRMAYTLPAGNRGWRVGANVSGLDYRVVTSDFNALDARGTSYGAGLEASYPLIRSRLSNLYLNLAYDRKDFDNQSSGATTTRYATASQTVGLAANHFDEWGGGGANSASLTFSAGTRVNRTGTTDQSFGKLRYSLSRQQVISNTLSVYVLLNGQEADTSIDTSEKIYLGGSGGVRAYPSNEGTGDSGLLANFELRVKLPEGFVLTAFFDHGSVRSRSAAGYDLQGAGLALAWQTPWGLNARVSWAHRIGDNPNPTAIGNDQDGSLERNRLWLTLSLPF